MKTRTSIIHVIVKLNIVLVCSSVNEIRVKQLRPVHTALLISCFRSQFSFRCYWVLDPFLSDIGKKIGIGIGKKKSDGQCEQTVNVSIYLVLCFQRGNKKDYTKKIRSLK